MFKLNEKYEIDWKTSKSDCITYSPTEKNAINSANSRIYVNISREYSVNSVPISYLDLDFDLLHAATNNRYASNYDIRWVIWGGFALIIKYKLTTSSGKHFEDIYHAHIVSLLYKLLTTSKRSDDLSSLAFRALTKDDIFNQTYLMMISDRLMVKMTLDIIYTFST